MKITFKKIISLVLVVVLFALLFTMSCSAGKVSKEYDAKFTYIATCGGSIDHGTFSTTVTAKITGKASVTSVKIKMELQKLSSGTYSTIKTWEETFSGNVGSMEESKVTNALSTYRLKATFTAYSGSASETKTVYFDE
jgi:hypothetical protein